MPQNQTAEDTSKAQAAENPSGPFGQNPFGRIEQVIHRSYYRFSQSNTWQPAVNIYEDETSFYICAELAGLEKDQISVDISGQQIRILGERPAPLPANRISPECILRMEIDSGAFERTVELPEQAEMDSAEARLELGLLWITVRKRAT